MNDSISGRIKKKCRQLAKGFALHVYYPLLYRRSAAGPADPDKAVFLEVRENRLTDSLALLWAGCKKRGMKTVLVSIGEGMVSAGRMNQNCVKAIPELADASVIFLDDTSYFLSALPLRPETKVVQAWHACGAFKRFGFSSTDTAFGIKRKELEQSALYRRFDLVTVSSPEVIWAYEEAFHLEDRPGRVRALGVSRTDVFFDREYVRSAKERVTVRFPEASGKKIILYAPTFRGKTGSAKAPGALDYRKLSEVLSAEYVLLIKHHPMVKKRDAIPAELSGFVRDVSDECSIEELLCAADICISDYSSLIFEYSLFERPMIFFAFDLEDYFDERGFYYPYEEFAPGPVCRTTEEVIRAVKDAENDFDRQRVGAFREKFMSSCDGKSTDRILEQVLGR